MPGLILRRSQRPSKGSKSVEAKDDDVVVAKAGRAIGV
jgi:hypothetical protein